MWECKGYNVTDDSGVHAEAPRGGPVRYLYTRGQVSPASFEESPPMDKSEALAVRAAAVQGRLPWETWIQTHRPDVWAWLMQDPDGVDGAWRADKAEGQ